MGGDSCSKGCMFESLMALFSINVFKICIIRLRRTKHKQKEVGDGPFYLKCLFSGSPTQGVQRSRDQGCVDFPHPVRCLRKSSILQVSLMPL